MALLKCSGAHTNFSFQSTSNQRIGEKEMTPFLFILEEPSENVISVRVWTKHDSKSWY